MNVGFSEAVKADDFTCVIFHDVDLIPEDARNDYGCPSSPRHMSTAVSRMDYKLVLRYMTRSSFRCCGRRCDNLVPRQRRERGWEESWRGGLTGLPRSIQFLHAVLKREVLLEAFRMKIKTIIKRKVWFQSLDQIIKIWFKDPDKIQYFFHAVSKRDPPIGEGGRGGRTRIWIGRKCSSSRLGVKVIFSCEGLVEGCTRGNIKMLYSVVFHVTMHPQEPITSK